MVPAQIWVHIGCMDPVIAPPQRAASRITACFVFDSCYRITDKKLSTDNMIARLSARPTPQSHATMLDGPNGRDLSLALMPATAPPAP